MKKLWLVVPAAVVFLGVGITLTTAPEAEAQVIPQNPCMQACAAEYEECKDGCYVGGVWDITCVSACGAELLACTAACR